MAKIAPGTGIDEKQKDKIINFRKRWKKVVDDAKGENLKTGAFKKEACDGLVEEAERFGIPAQAFRKKMRELDHLDKASGVRKEIEDEAILDAFDKMGIAIPVQSFFDFGEPAEPAKKSRKKKGDEPAEDRGANVTDLHPEPEEAVA